MAPPRFDHHDEEKLEQTTQDVRRIVLYVMGSLITIVIAITGFWMGNVSARVRDIELKNAEYFASYDTKFVGIDKDHALFKEWLTRIEGKLDRITEGDSVVPRPVRSLR